MTPQAEQPLSEASRSVPPEPILPPRPNLGPEPWPEAAEGNGWVLLISALILMLVLGLGFWIRSRAKRRARAASSDSGRGQNHLPSFASPDDRRILRAERLREALITAFGPSWRAKTTEEIAADPALLTRLGPERSEQVVTILAEADRAKFAGPSSEDHPPGEADDHNLTELISTLTSLLAQSGR